MGVCRICRKEITKTNLRGLCQNCYEYERKGGTYHDIPPKGVIAYDDSGKVICHMCGRSYKKLGSHIKESHNMTAEQYREEFGLCKRTKITEKSYSNKMRDFAYKYEMPMQLMIYGKNTRITPNKKLRLGKKVRLQECLDKHNRMISLGGVK